MKLINIYKQLLKESELNQKFDYIHDFNEFGLARVFIKNKGWNIINREGKLLSDIWFNYINIFNKFGLVDVTLNDKYNFINLKGELLFNIWFDYISVFDKSGFKKVMLNNKYNYISSEGKLIFNKWINKSIINNIKIVSNNGFMIKYNNNYKVIKI